METAAAELHDEHAARADCLARTARARASHASSAADGHQKCASACEDDLRRELHHRAADCHRDAQIVHDSAAALQALHADHERRLADFLRAHAVSLSTPSADAKDLNARYERVARQQILADDPDQTADKRDRVADERDRIADERDRIADERDAAADAREDRLDARERELNDLIGHRRLLDDTPQHVARAREAVVRADDRIHRQEQARAREIARIDRDHALISREATRTRRDAAARDRAPPHSIAVTPNPPAPASEVAPDVRRRQWDFAPRCARP